MPASFFLSSREIAFLVRFKTMIKDNKIADKKINILEYLLDFFVVDILSHSINMLFEYLKGAK